jgi:hypothetical protein
MHRGLPCRYVFAEIDLIAAQFALLSYAIRALYMQLSSFRSSNIE